MLSQFFSFKFLKVLFDQNKTIEEYTKTKFQTKILGSSAPNGAVPGLGFSGLVVGKKYRLSGMVYGQATDASGFARLFVYNYVDGSLGVSSLLFKFEHDQSAGGSGSTTLAAVDSTPFIATHSNIFVAAQLSNGVIAGNGTKEQTFLTLEELPNHEETTQWT